MDINLKIHLDRGREITAEEAEHPNNNPEGLFYAICKLSVTAGEGIWVDSEYVRQAYSARFGKEFKAEESTGWFGACLNGNSTRKASEEFFDDIALFLDHQKHRGRIHYRITPRKFEEVKEYIEEHGDWEQDNIPDLSS